MRRFCSIEALCSANDWERLLATRSRARRAVELNVSEERSCKTLIAGRLSNGTEGEGAHIPSTGSSANEKDFGRTQATGRGLGPELASHGFLAYDVFPDAGARVCAVKSSFLEDVNGRRRDARMLLLIHYSTVIGGARLYSTCELSRSFVKPSRRLRAHPRDRKARRGLLLCRRSLSRNDPRTAL